MFSTFIDLGVAKNVLIPSPAPPFDFAALGKRLGDSCPPQDKGKCSDGSQRQERYAIAEVLNQLTKNCVRNSVQYLDSNQALRIVGHGIEKRADRQDAEAQQQ
jgi:hypothetical protein